MRGSRRALSSTAIAIGLALIASQAALAASGDRDTSFGGDGLAAVNATSSNERGSTVAARNNKIVVAGLGFTASTGRDIVVARFDMSGNPDTTFGGGDGVFTLDLGGDDEIDNGLVVNADNSILVSGWSAVSGGHYKLFVVKLKANGTLDGNFGGGDGIFISDFGHFGALGYDMAVLDSGKIVVSGSVYTSSSDGDFAVYRFTAKGKPDTTFGGGDGEAILNMGAGYDEAWRLVALANGKLLLGGWVETDTIDVTYEIALARFTSTGQIDSTFGHNGSVHYDISPSTDYVVSMAVSNKKILLLTYQSDKAGFMRLKMNGSRDRSIGGGDGTLFRPVAGMTSFNDVQIDSSGRIVVGGSGSGNMMVARFKANFALDTGFGSGGSQTGPEFGEGWGLAIQPDDKILLSGHDSSGNTSVARFLP